MIVKYIMDSKSSKIKNVYEKRQSYIYISVLFWHEYQYCSVAYLYQMDAVQLAIDILGMCKFYVWQINLIHNY